MNKWERREGKLQQRSKSKFKQSDDVYDSYKARASAKKIARLRKRWVQEVKDINDYVG